MEEVAEARRLAKALFGICRERHLVDRVAGELGEIAEREQQSAELHDFLSHPEIPINEKRKLLRLIVPDSVAGETAAFLDLLLRHRQLSLLDEIRRIFLDLRQESFGVLKALVETARPMSHESRARLKEALSTATGRDVMLVEQLRPELIGGVRIHVGDRIVDGSLAGRLAKIKEHVLAMEAPASGGGAATTATNG